MNSSRRFALLPYVWAVAVFFAAFAVQSVVAHELADRPFVLFLVCVILVARYWGLGPSVLALVLSAAATRYYFIEPRGSFVIADPYQQNNYWMFVLLAGFVSFLVASQRRAQALALEQTAAAQERQRELERQIVERERVEERVRTRERQLRGILDNATAVIFLKDRDGRYILMNRRFEEKFPYGNVSGKRDEDFFPPPIAANFRESDAKVWREQRPYDFEEPAPQTDGIHIFRSVKFPIFDERGEMIALGGISTDVTDLKQALTALEDEQGLLRNLIDVQEKERQFLCHEFHDGLIQYAVGAILTLEGCCNDLSAADQAAVRRAIDSLRKGVEDGRRVIRGVQPPVLRGFGLATALEELVGQYATSGILVTCKCDPDLGELPENVQLTIYRVAQEALNNARKYSGTDVVRIEVRRKGADLTLDVRDFGCGFEVATARKRGFGLIGMTERVRLLGGDCLIHSEPDEGTSIRVRLPIGIDAGAASSPLAITGN